MKKHFYAFLLLFIIVFSATSCGKEPESESSSFAEQSQKEDVSKDILKDNGEAVDSVTDEKEPLEIELDLSNKFSEGSVPVMIDLGQFDRFDGLVTMTFDVDVHEKTDWFCISLVDTLSEANSVDMNKYAIDLDSYEGQHAECELILFSSDIKRFKDHETVYISGDGYTLNRVTLSGYKNKNYVDENDGSLYEGMEALEIVLDYPGGMDISDYDFSLVLDVDQFDRFYGPITILYDIDVLEDAEWYEMNFMTTWNDSGFYDNLDYASENLYDYRGTHTVIQKELSVEEVERYKNNGTLMVCGCGYKINSFTLRGYKNEKYVAPVAPSNSPVSVHGQLSVSSVGFVDENGDPYRITGTAIGWDTLCPQLVNLDTYSYLRDEWGINAIRAGMEPHSDNQRNGLMDPYVNWDYWLYYMDHKIDTIIAAGLYVVVDYHNYQNPLDTLDGAKKFFEHIAEKYAGCPNIIYEIGNEPNFGEWKHTKQYADVLIPLIRSYSPDAVIVCPSAGWAGKILDACNDPLDYDNVIYTYHLYCNPFYKEGYDELTEVLKRGFPVFLTEYNTCGVSNEPNDYASDEKWYALISKYKLSYIYHNILINYDSYDCSEAIGLLPSVSELSGWTEDDMGESMRYFYHKIRHDNGLE